jgi:hypothetical protein
MIVAGWADGYRNNSLRTVAALRDAGVPHRLLAGPWAHADPATAMPGPRIDLMVETVAWWDRWLRHAPRDAGAHEDCVDVFVRTSTRPQPDLEDHDGFWIRDEWPSPSTRGDCRELAGPATLDVVPDVGTSAWIDCAGHLPWGLSGDQRADDDRSLRWEWPADGLVLLGQPRVRLRVAASAPEATLSVKLCDVFPDGTSALVTRGSLDLAYRGGVHAPAQRRALVPGEEVEVEVALDACAYAFAPGQRLRLSVAGADWPNTVAPPAPVSLRVGSGTLELPLWSGNDRPPPRFTPGEPSSGEEPEGVTWTEHRDVLRRTTTCAVRHGTAYAVPHAGTASEQYAGEVVVDRRTFAQRASAECRYRLTWPGVEVTVRSTMRVEVSATGYRVAIEVEAYDGEERVSQRRWAETVPR